MGEHATTKQAGAARPSTSSKRPSVEMSAGDRNDFVDLLLQRAAEAAIEAKNADEKTLLQESAVTITRTRAALEAVRSQGKGAASPALLKSVDGAFASLDALKARLDGLDDPAMQKQATEVASAASALTTTFVPRGWKPPRSAPELRARAKSADRAGARAVTTGEKAKLARLHLGAARQHLIDGWAGINAGRVDAVDRATGELGAALAFASDPRLMGELDTMTADLEVTESVMLRLIDTVQRSHPSKISSLKLLANHLDRILALQNKQGGWVARIQPPSSAPSTPAVATSAQVANEPKQPADAAPPQHNGEKRTFRTWIRLDDKNLENEHLGSIEITFDAMLAENGQVYIQDDWVALPQLSGRASMLNVDPRGTPSSHNDHGRRYAVLRPVLVISTGGQTKTNESGIAAKGGAHGAEVGVHTKSGSSSLQKRKGFIRRQYRVEAMPASFEQFEYQKDGNIKSLKTRLVLFEDKEFREDLNDFEVDDAEVGGGVFDTDWEIDSE